MLVRRAGRATATEETVLDPRSAVPLTLPCRRERSSKSGAMIAKPSRLSSNMKERPEPSFLRSRNERKLRRHRRARHAGRPADCNALPHARLLSIQNYGNPSPARLPRSTRTEGGGLDPSSGRARTVALFSLPPEHRSRSAASGRQTGECLAHDLDGLAI